jgi:hypothetical protein
MRARLGSARPFHRLPGCFSSRIIQIDRNYYLIPSVW